MKIKTIRCHYIPIRINKIQKTDDIKYWQICRATETLNSLLMRMQKGTPSLEDSWAVSYKTNRPLPYCSASVLLGI